MCGIAGLIDLDNPEIPSSLIDTMRDVMITRGPDGTGEYRDRHIAMTMRRLSVIDPDHGWQPFKNAEGEIIAFQNGEIYNYLRLKKELESEGYHFLTNCDTEVLVHGYARWSMAGLLERIDGMYAIAIFDRRAGKLHLARDRFGEKPLFYSLTDRRFAYASDLRALARLPWITNDIDTAGLDYYLALHYVPGESTIIRSIKRVLPGEHLTVRLSNLSSVRNRYYRPPLGAGEKTEDEELADALQSTVKSRLIADVPVGVFLSGGLDSSIIAAVAARSSPGISTFSMGFKSPDHDESRYAQQVAEHIGSTHHHFVFDEKSFSDLLPVVAQALDEPVGDQALLPLFWLCREARKHVTVALSGEGADELFAGYRYYERFVPGVGFKGSVKRLLRGDSGKQYRRLISNQRPITPSGFPLLADAGRRADLMNGGMREPDGWESDLFAWLADAGDSLQQATAVDVATWLPDDLLVKFDRMAMANSLEGRTPYLEPRLADMALRGIGPENRMTGGMNKIALRRIASRWLPPEICGRHKQGFVLPMRKWLARWIEDRGGPQQYFSQRAFPYLNMEKVASMAARDLKSGVVNERLLFALVLLCEWYASHRSHLP